MKCQRLLHYTTFLKEDSYNPIDYTNNNFTVDGKLASVTFWSSEDTKQNSWAFSDKDSPSARDYERKGLYISSDATHKQLLNDVAPIKEVLASKFGEPVITQPAAKAVTFAKGEKSILILRCSR